MSTEELLRRLTPWLYTLLSALLRWLLRRYLPRAGAGETPVDGGAAAQAERSRTNRG